MMHDGLSLFLMNERMNEIKTENILRLMNMSYLHRMRRGLLGFHANLRGRGLELFHLDYSKVAIPQHSSQRTFPREI